MSTEAPQSSFEAVIRLHDTDAAGRIFFASLFRILHDAFEQFLEKQGLSLGLFLHDSECSLAIVHAEADYAQPLAHGDRITIQLGAEMVGTTSFTMRYVVCKDGQEAASAKTVHVAISPSTGRKRELPDALRSALS